MVRLKDIAQAAGVSPVNVSAALGGIGRVSPETREAIRKLAVEMDYRPSSAARVLRNKPTVDAGMLIADGQDMLVRDFIRWCEKFHLRHQLELISSSARLAPSLLADNFAAGCLHVGYLGEAVREFLAKNPNYPFVAINEQHTFCVRSNFVSGARQAIQYLAALGHRNFCLTVGDREYDLHRQLRQGLDEALREFHFDQEPLRQEMEVKGIPHVEVMQRCVEMARAALRRTPRPTAFFCCGMLEARSLIYAALEMGLVVPRDLSIIAVGYPKDAEDTYPAVTSLGHDFEQQITQAMLLLQRRIVGMELESQDILVDTKLEIRSSTAKLGGA